MVNSTKNGKSNGYDKIPSEVLKFPKIIDVLHSLFHLCFDTGILPSLWRKAMISPVPKDSTKDKQVPLNDRGKSLLSVVGKLYSSELNNRLLTYLNNKHQTSRRRAFSKIHQSATEIVCVCLSQVCKTPMLYVILKLRF